MNTCKSISDFRKQAAQKEKLKKAAAKKAAAEKARVAENKARNKGGSHITFCGTLMMSVAT